MYGGIQALFKGSHTGPFWGEGRGKMPLATYVYDMGSLLLSAEGHVLTVDLQDPVIFL